MRFSTVLVAFTATTAIAAPTGSTNQLVARQDLAGLLGGLTSFLPFDVSSFLPGAPAPAPAGELGPGSEAAPAPAGSFLSQIPFVGGLFQMLGLKYTDIPADGKFTPDMVEEIQAKLRAMYPVVGKEE